MVLGALGGALMMKFLPGRHSGACDDPSGGTGLLWLWGRFTPCSWRWLPSTFKADQTLVGTAMNLLGTAAATVFVKAMNTAESVDNVSSTIQYIGAKKAFLVNIGGFEFNWFMLLALIALVAVLYRHCTKPASACACAPAASIPRRRTAWASTSIKCATPAC